MSQHGYGPPPVAAAQRTGEGPPVAMIVASVLVAVLGAACNALFSFGMIFATDSCGTSAGSSAALCHTDSWLLLVALPWAGLLGGGLTTVLVAVAARRRGRSAWLGFAAGLALYAVLCLVTVAVVFS